MRIIVINSKVYIHGLDLHDAIRVAMMDIANSVKPGEFESLRHVLSLVDNPNDFEIETINCHGRHVSAEDILYLIRMEMSCAENILSDRDAQAWYETMRGRLAGYRMAKDIVENAC